MEFHFVGVDKMAGIFQDVEAGIKFRFIFKQHKVQDTDADAFFKYVIVLSFFNLSSIHFRNIKQCAVAPDFKLRQLDLGVNVRVVIHQDPDVKDAELVVFVGFAQAGV